MAKKSGMTCTLFRNRMTSAYEVVEPLASYTMILALILLALPLVMTFSGASAMRISASSSKSSSLLIFSALCMLATVDVYALILAATSTSMPAALYAPPLESLIATTLLPNSSLDRDWA